jgi:MoxR-like ATPase
MSKLAAAYQAVRSALTDRFIVGHEELIELLVTAYFSRGHVLIEGPPGTGKTLAAKLLAHLLGRSFKRIQFTSDMLPADILGAHLYSPASREFEFLAGPIFSEIVLADEINRTPPRTQSALLEAMEERQVTIDGKQMKIHPAFFVVATQNPRDYEGTFPLPEVQLDRFLFRVVVNHSSLAEEFSILERTVNRALPPDLSQLQAVSIDLEELEQLRHTVRVDASLLKYITELLAATRSHRLLASGSSIRGGIALLNASQVLAAIRGRDYVIVDDIKFLAKPTLAHRVRLTPEAQVSFGHGLQSNTKSELSMELQIIEEILQTVSFPT